MGHRSRLGHSCKGEMPVRDWLAHPVPQRDRVLGWATTELLASLLRPFPLPPLPGMRHRSHQWRRLGWERGAHKAGEAEVHRHFMATLHERSLVPLQVPAAMTGGRPTFWGRPGHHVQSLMSRRDPARVAGAPLLVRGAITTSHPPFGQELAATNVSSTWST